MMRTRRLVVITAPSRLHFGLLHLGASREGRRGGVGLMIDMPGKLTLSCEASLEFEVQGLGRDRVVEFAHRFARRVLRADFPPCRLTVHSLVPEHVGLGSGTQLALAVATGVAGVCGLLSAEAVAALRPDAADLPASDAGACPVAGSSPRSIEPLQAQGAITANGNVGIACQPSLIPQSPDAASNWFPGRPRLLDRLFGTLGPVDLARIVGRGRRSLVGTWGFFRGGMLMDDGTPRWDCGIPDENRIELPAPWRFVLARVRRACGLSGEKEDEAFNRLAAVAGDHDREREDLGRRLLSAARRGDFATFSRCLHDFGHLAGGPFTEVQGGPYAGVEARELVRRVQSWGVQGVGQSSWGPILFAVVADPPSAGSLLSQIRRWDPDRRFALGIGIPSRTGAAMTWSDIPLGRAPRMGDQPPWRSLSASQPERRGY